MQRPAQKPLKRGVVPLKRLLPWLVPLSIANDTSNVRQADLSSPRLDTNGFLHSPAPFVLLPYSGLASVEAFGYPPSAEVDLHRLSPDRLNLNGSVP